MASAQVSNTLYWEIGQDSVVALRPGTSTITNLTMYSSSCLGLSAYSLTLNFDPVELEDPTATAVQFSGFPDPTVTNRPGSMDMVANGLTTSCLAYIGRVGFTLQPAALRGSTVQIQINSLVDRFGNPATLPAVITPVTLRICHATKIWGDLDGSLAVNTRDALIALTSAVGLPVTGFDTSVGDVDRDDGVTSRDALMILSHSLGIATASRVSLGVPDACPSLTGPAPRYRTIRTVTP
jgi:hypothetical protein